MTRLLKWDVVEGASSYYVYVNGALIWTPEAITICEFNLNALLTSAGQIVTFCVVAVAINGTLGFPSEFTTVMPLSAPQNLRIE